MHQTNLKSTEHSWLFIQKPSPRKWWNKSRPFHPHPSQTLTKTSFFPRSRECTFHWRHVTIRPHSSYVFLWLPTWEPADLCVSSRVSDTDDWQLFCNNDGKGFDLRGAGFSDETRLWIKALLNHLTLCLSKIKMILLDCRLSCFNDVTFYWSRGICSSVLTRKILGGTHLWTQYIIGLFHHATHACTRILMQTHVCRYLEGYVSLLSLGQIRILMRSGAA